MESSHLLTTNLDLLFAILSLLPTEDLLRAKSVCRAWFNLISHPTFLHAHCSRPTPIAACFTNDFQSPRAPPTRNFKPFSDKERFPTCIWRILEDSEKKLVATSHGLLCFCRNETYTVGNPVTSRWVDIIHDVPSSGFSFSGHTLVYDPVESYHFKLVVGMFRMDPSNPDKYYIRFHIYSSETSSWTVSSEYTHTERRDPMFHSIGRVMGRNAYKPCKIGGGSLCWSDEFDFLAGYEISTDTYWTTAFPTMQERYPRGGMEHNNGEVYFVMLGPTKAKVLRLEGKERWVLEGEGKNRRLGKVGTEIFAYDKARGALLVGGGSKSNVYAFNLSSSRLELIRKSLPSKTFEEPGYSHANTLAPFYGGELRNWV